MNRDKNKDLEDCVSYQETWGGSAEREKIRHVVTTNERSNQIRPLFNSYFPSQFSSKCVMEIT